MRILVTGANGQLGRDVVITLAARGHEVIGSGRQPFFCGMTDLPSVRAIAYLSLDITEQTAVFEAVRKLRPDAVIHCAAWTAVDAAEDAAKTAHAVNSDGTRHLAEACREAHAKLLYVSTDYVFDGSGSTPRKPDGDPCGPLNVYGQTKLDGERAVRDTLEKFFIVRTAWVFGGSGKNFLRTMLDAGRTHGEVRVVNDQIGTPTYARDLARLLADMIETEKYGCYHAVNEGGGVSRYELCRELYRQAGIKTRVIPVTTSEFGAGKAVRPRNSVLDTSKLAENGFAPLPDRKDALRRFLSEVL